MGERIRERMSERMQKTQIEHDAQCLCVRARVRVQERKRGGERESKKERV